MIRSIRKTPLIRLSFQTFVLTISLANTFAQTGISVRNGRESALSALKQELLELEKPLIEAHGEGFFRSLPGNMGQDEYPHPFEELVPRKRFQD